MSTVPPASSPASREVVLAWMDAEGRGYAAAADHFNLNRETVKSWVKRRGAPTRAPMPPRPKEKAKSAGGSPKVSKAATPRAPPRKPPPDPRAREADRLARLGDATKAHIRSGVRGLGRFIASTNDERPLTEGDEDDDRSIDYRQVEAAARALKVLLEIAPGIDAFEEQTSAGGAQAGPSAEDEARLDAAMLEPVSTIRPGPRLVGTGG